MKILQILPMLDVGGVETGTVDLTRELIKRGHKLIVVSNGGRMVKDIIDLNAKHIKLPVDKKSLGTLLRMVERLRHIIREEGVDIVHARSRVPAIIAFFATRRTNACFITTAHGYYSRHIFSRVMGWARFVIVASTVVGRHMIKDFGVPRERIRFIPRGVDLGRFKFRQIDISSPKTGYTIGVIGRITPIKGHRFFLQAIARVVRVFPKKEGLKILIIGDAPKDRPEYKDELNTLIRKLDIERFVEFLGTRHNIPEIISNLDLLVVPSVGEEAFGRVIIEAGASGVPVVATRTGGTIDIVENQKTGLLVKPGDIIEMVDAIVSLLKDRELARAIAQEARKKVEKEYILDKMAEDTLKVYEEAVGSKRILIIKMGAIGDVILAVPSIRAVRESFPKAFISVLVGIDAVHVLKKCPYIDDIIIYDRKGKDRGIKGLMKIGSFLRQKIFDMSIDFQNNTKSHIIAWLGAIPNRFAYNKSRFSFLVNNRLKYLKIKVSPVEEQFRLLKRAGINTIGVSRRLEVWYGKEDFSYIDNFLRNEWVGDEQILVGINIGGSWMSKRWPLMSFAKLSDMLAGKDIRVVITASKQEMDLADRFVKMTDNRVINAAGKTNISQLAVLIKRCKVFVTGDSAPMHIASSMGTSFIALFGPTDPARHFEPTQKGIVIKKEIACSPCYKSHCKKLLCMKRISVDGVFKKVMERIEK